MPEPTEDLCHWCNKRPIPAGRIFYCSDECALAANKDQKRRQYGRRYDHERSGDPFARSAAAAYRTCLRCGKSFRSTGPGHRRCTSCEDEVRHVRVSPHRMPPYLHHRIEAEEKADEAL